MGVLIAQSLPYSFAVGVFVVVAAHGGFVKVVVLIGSVVSHWSYHLLMFLEL